ncbi:MAG: hypothetical protein ABI231_09135 [Candidatus Tumulicola sp.]
MNRIVLAAAALMLVLAPAAGLRAQVPVPTPSPDPHDYVDPGMHFTAPADAVLVGRRYIPVGQLPTDLTPVGVWVLRPGKEDMRSITLSMEAFAAAPDQWEGQFESQMHSSGGNGLLIRRKTSMALLNGMPANFVEVTSGSGFTAQKQFAVVWADGQRGIVLSESSRLGDANADEALAVLKNVTAVRYPMQQP